MLFRSNDTATTEIYTSPHTLSLHDALPLSIGLYAQRLAQMQPGAKIAILGSGPIGLCVLLSSLAACDCTVYATDLLDARLAVARRCGAAWTANPKQIDVVRAIRELEPLGVDFVFECAGQQETLDQSIEQIGRAHV